MNMIIRLKKPVVSNISTVSLRHFDTMAKKKELQRLDATYDTQGAG
jgi:hypothetical protein